MAIYDAKPSKYEAVGNGSYLYRWNIEEIQVPDNSDSETTVIKWQCEEVTVWSPVTPNKVTEAVITSKWDNNYEQKLVNDYNAAKLGVYGSTTSTEATEKVAAYTAYLNERKALKEQIDADCAELGIL
jgi:hypothetical protein